MKNEEVIDCVPPIPAWRIRIAPEPAFVAREPQEVPWTEAGHRLGFRPQEDQAGDFWETLTYLALWLCGWGGLALCLF
jgi:hypothetical protein